MLGERLATQSEVIRAIVSGHSPCCGVPHRLGPALHEDRVKQHQLHVDPLAEQRELGGEVELLQPQGGVQRRLVRDHHRHHPVVLVRVLHRLPGPRGGREARRLGRRRRRRPVLLRRRRVGAVEPVALKLVDRSRPDLMQPPVEGFDLQRRKERRWFRGERRCFGSVARKGGGLEQDLPKAPRSTVCRHRVVRLLLGYREAITRQLVDYRLDLALNALD